MADEMDRNLSLELVRVTEAAALNAAQHMGRGDKNLSDGAAVNAMRTVLNSIEMDGIVVIGEGEKDEAPMLFVGERLGTGNHPEVDIAVDPIDGTRLLALGMPNAVSVIAIAERGSLYTAPLGIFYMNKIAVGPAARGVIDITMPIEWNLRRVAKAKSKPIADTTVVILDRPRHEKLIREVREAGARIKLITDGDVAGGLMTALDGTGIDVLMGVGGAPEAVVTAAALKCVGGDIQCTLYPRDDVDRQKALDAGADLSLVLERDDLCKGKSVFFSVTGITDGELVDGVKYFESTVTTHSILMRSKSGTIREVRARHPLDKLRSLAGLPYSPK